MKLKTNVFLWVFMATAVPLCALALSATTYSERLYLQDVHREVNESLNNIASEIRRRLLLERELLEGLAVVPALKAFIPVLARIAEGGEHPEFLARVRRLEQFLEDFQRIIPSMSHIRVLDVRGNTLVLVRAGHHSESFAKQTEGISYIEKVSDEPAFLRFLTQLPPGEFGYTLLPHNSEDPDAIDPEPVFDTVLALGKGERASGYLVAKVRIDPIDRVLHVSPRLHKGELLIAELNPVSEQRDGLILYDDKSGIALDNSYLHSEYLQTQEPELYRWAQTESFGFIDSSDGTTRTFYTDFLPYSNQLLSWVVASRIDLNELGAPFHRIRIAILMFALLALLGSLILARFGASQIAQPVMELAGQLTAYARGKRKLRVNIQGSDEIRQAGFAFNNMAITLEQAEHERDQAQAAMLQNAKLASLGKLAAGIGHEINNPLNNILSLAKLMERGSPSDESSLKEDIVSIREEALRASRTIRAVLNFARQVPPEYIWFEVEPWLREILSLVKQEANVRRVSLESKVHGRYQLEGDRDLLEQTLINLLLNALQVSPPSATVKVVVSKADRNLKIEVQDEGPGIKPEDLEHAFDPFFTTKPTGEGSGLGLSISLGIVEHHSGKLTLRNRPKGGVTATVILPRVIEAEKPIISAVSSAARC